MTFVVFLFFEYIFHTPSTSSDLAFPLFKSYIFNIWSFECLENCQTRLQTSSHSYNTSALCAAAVRSWFYGELPVKLSFIEFQ